MIFHTETITEEMLSIGKTIFTSLDRRFYLAGGTALALQIGHRKSIDLDYFLNDHINTEKLTREISDLFSKSKVAITFQEKDTLWCTIGGVKVSFISRFDALQKPPQEEAGLRLAEKEDIVVMKLSAICSREEYKDYFDLACLAQKTDPRSWIVWWQKTYPDADPTSWIVALTAGEHVKPVPLDIFPEYQSLSVIDELKKAGKEITKSLQ